MPRCSRLLFLALFLSFLSLGQEFRSTLSGQVVDPTGAIIPGAKIIITEIDTGARVEMVSGGNGQYTAPFLVPGAYQVVVEAPGFKRTVRDRIQISTNTRVTEDFTLEIGSAKEVVNITAEAPLLTTATASTGQVIESRQIENLPMNGRTPLVLAQLAFGVIPNSDPKFNRPFDNSGPSGFAMGGSPAQRNELLLDGTPDMTGNRRVAYNPPVDAVSEVKVESFQSDAAYGNTGGGTVNVVMRGGSNEFHGTLYEFNQVSALAATPFFTNAASQKKPVTRYNQYGGTVGGPVLIPKLFNGKDRMFWFFGYEGIKDSFPEPITTTVPTEAMRNGDFSGLLKLGANYQLYDPTTGVLTGGKVVRQPFAGNVIPSNRLSAIAKNYLAYYPLPNQAGNADFSSNYLSNSVRRDNFGSYLGRFDWNVSDRHKFFFNMRTNDRIEDRNNRFFNIATGNFLSRVNWGATFDDVYTFTPTLLLNTRFGWNRFIEGNSKPSSGFDPTKLGFPSALAANSTRFVMPIVNPSGFNQLGDNGGDRTPFDTWQLFESLTKVMSSHTLKVGADFRLAMESSNSFGNSAGNFTFDSNWVKADSTANGIPQGGSMAALMLGLPSGGNFDVNGQRTNQSFYQAVFVQDDWRVRPNLTVNLGLRYERETGTVERWNRSLNGFDATAVNKVTAAAKAAYAASPLAFLPASQFNPLGGVTFSGNGRRNIYDTASASFSPRFGISWSPKAFGGKTVVRAGTGVFYFTYGTFGVQQPGFSQQTAFVASNDSSLTPFATLSNPFPTGIQQPVGSSLGVDTYLGQNITFTNPHLQQPYSIRWNVDIQHQLGKNWLFEIGYLGNHAVHLTEDRNLNAIPLQYLSTLPVRDQATIDRLGTVVSNPFRGLLPGTGLNGTTTSAGSLLRPFPQFSGDGGVKMNSINDGSSYFHMLQMRLDKRFANGLQVTANYQHSRLMERIRHLNAQDPLPEKRVSPDDRPNRFVSSVAYDLPFGRGKHLLGSLNRWADLAVGGWILNSIYTIQSGGPLNFESTDFIYFGGPLNLDPRGVGGAFDTTRFETNSARQLANHVRTFPSRFSNLRLDKANNIDLSVVKNFRIAERVSVQYRLEAFNAFNHAEMDNPDLNPTSKTFGKITNQPNLARSIQMGLRLKF